MSDEARWTAPSAGTAPSTYRATVSDPRLLTAEELAQIRWWHDRRQSLPLDPQGMSPNALFAELGYLSQRLAASTPDLLAHIDALERMLALAMTELAIVRGNLDAIRTEDNGE